jgi:hypothetical protein
VLKNDRGVASHEGREAETVSAETQTQPQKPANCGLGGSLWEISRLGSLRGGPGRIRTSNQTVMASVKRALARSKLALSQFGENRPPFNTVGFFDSVRRTLREHAALALPNPAGLLGKVRGSFRRREAAAQCDMP